MLTRYEFELLSYLEMSGDGRYSVRELSDTLCISGTMIMNCLETLLDRGLLGTAGSQDPSLSSFVAADFELFLTSLGREALEPFRVRRAIIVAAGFGSRMMPATADRPKPMVRVNGVRIIDTLLDALLAVGIEDIVIVGGYRFEKLKELKKDQPTLRFIENPDFDTMNNISSAMLALDELRGGCYFCEADLYVSHPENVIRKYQFSSNILGSYSMETDDWSFKMKDGYLSDYQKGNTYCYNYYGISYWTAEDCEKLRKDFSDVFYGPGGKDYFWEYVPFVLRKEHYKVEIRPCRKEDIMEIDNYYELAQLDPGYHGSGKNEAAL